MITKEQVKNVLIILNNEYDGMLKGNLEVDNLKIDTWFAKLKHFSYEQVQQAVSRLLDSKVYGLPNISDLMEILKPKMEQQNEGMEFAQRLLDLCNRFGTDNMVGKVVEEYGEVGYSVYMQVKNELRELKVDDNNTFKAQIRSIYNSCKEREQVGMLEGLPYQNEAKKFIDEGISKMVENKKLGGTNNVR